MNDLIKDKRGVFGLPAIQAFFAIILGISLLAYVIVVIMGTLSGTTILNQQSTTVINESISGITNTTAQVVSGNTSSGAGSFSVVEAINATDGAIIPSSNYTINSATGALISTDALCNGVNGGTSDFFCGWDWNVTYSYDYNTQQQDDLDTILTNTSTGVTGFFSSINPIYAILAVLVIILVLVVLVRVVQNPKSEAGTPQL